MLLYLAWQVVMVLVLAVITVDSAVNTIKKAKEIAASYRIERVEDTEKRGEPRGDHQPPRRAHRQ
jgi:hypothetical protein